MSRIRIGNFDVQPWPNFIREEKRLCLTRIERPYTGRKFSISIQFKLEDLWIGAFWRREDISSLLIWVCLIPCFPIRLHFKR